jgi:hypothetical protein
MIYAYGQNMVESIKEELAERGLPESLDAAVRLGVPKEWAEACVVGIERYKEAVRYVIAKQEAQEEYAQREYEMERRTRGGELCPRCLALLPLHVDNWPAHMVW